MYTAVARKNTFLRLQGILLSLCLLMKVNSGFFCVCEMVTQEVVVIYIFEINLFFEKFVTITA